MYVAIIKRVGDLEGKLKPKGLPDLYPLACAEAETIEELHAAFPGKQVLTQEEYRGFASALAIIFDHAAEAKPWWKFWGKG